MPIEWNEPFGIVFAESLACGTPVISSPCGALPSIVENGVHGFLVKDNCEGVAAVRRLVDIDRRKCRDQAETRFCAASIAKIYSNIYSQAIHGEAVKASK